MMKQSEPFTEDDVHDYVDGRMDKARRDAFEAFLEKNPAINKVVEDYQRQNEMLRILFGGGSTKRYRQNNGNGSQ